MTKHTHTHLHNQNQHIPVHQCTHTNTRVCVWFR